MRLLRGFVRWVNAPLPATVIGGLLVAILAGGASTKLLGSPWGWVGYVPAWAWAGFGGVVITAAAMVVWDERRQRRREVTSAPAIAVIRRGLYGWLTSEFEYASVAWRIHVPVPGPLTTRADLEPDTLEVETPPRCPECGVELVESRRSWVRGRKWSCDGCGFVVNHQSSFYVVRGTVERIARRDLEREVETARGWRPASGQ